MSVPLSGRIPTKINYVDAVTARDVTVTVTQAQNVHVGAFGPIGRVAGQPRYKATVKFSVPADKAEFEQLAANAAGRVDGATGFDFTYTKGTETYTLTDCGIDSDGVSSDQDAGSEQNISIVAVDRHKVS